MPGSCWTTSEADGGYGFAEKDLWVTVYEEDDVSFDLWRRIAGLPRESYPASRQRGELLVDGPAGSGWS
jgi:alanyl-tRNA synthetase